jgi:LPPG:FO 2-phospho-L-lactate transferase
MCDEPVPTLVRTGGRWRPFQEFMILERASAPIEGVELRGVEDARPTPEALAAIAEAEAIVIGPSNPVTSIGPILALPGMRDALAAAAAPVVAVSPFVGGRAIKGPTDAFCAHAGIGREARGVVSAYAGVIDGLVADDAAEGDPTPSLRVDTLLDSPARRREVARMTLEFAASLSARRGPAGETL